MEGQTDTYQNFKFPKKERLCSKKLIDALFKEGASFHLYPFTVKYLPSPLASSDCNQILISVSKRIFKRAVDRNKVKRLIRESYRLHKHALNTHLDSQKFYLIAYIYMGKEIHPFQFVEKKLIRTFERLQSELDKSKQQRASK